MVDRRGYLSLDFENEPSVSHSSGRVPGLQSDLFSGAAPPTSHNVDGTNTTPTGTNPHADNPAIMRPRSESTANRQRKRWDHIKDLDDFFTRIYTYYQRSGFNAMLVEEVLFLVQIIFMVWFSTFLAQCIDYNVLFRNKLAKGHNSTDKIRFGDVLISQCTYHLNMFVVVMLLLSMLLIIYYAIRACSQLAHAWEIRSFYHTALNIDSDQMYNMNWHQVMQRLTQAQHDLQLCIQKRDLSELDIYQRILRHKNYLIALVNKDVFPPLLAVPFMGDIRYLSCGLRWNLELLLFHGPWSPWQDYYTLKSDYKQREKRQKLVSEMQNVIFWLAIAQLVLSPVIFVWTLLYLFFSTAELVKRQPNALSMRKWSNYGRLYLRHFNELEHELYARLNRAHRPSTQYMEQFTSSRWVEICAQNVAFYAGALFAVLVVLSVWDEDVLQLEHALTVMTLCGLVVYGCAAFIADENLVWCPEWLMDVITAQIYYVDDSWKRHAHTERVRHEFSQLFQYKAYYLCEESISPFLTPVLMLYWLRPRVPLVVDFFRKFTMNVPGLGDVCSFAQMDLQRHGDPRWNGQWHVQRGNGPPPDINGPDFDYQAANGKTEMSLVQFTIRNPTWQPPNTAERFLNGLHKQTEADIESIRQSQQHESQSQQSSPLSPNRTSTPIDNPLAASLSALAMYHATATHTPLATVPNLACTTMTNQSTMSTLGNQLYPPVLSSTHQSVLLKKGSSYGGVEMSNMAASSTHNRRKKKEASAEPQRQPVDLWAGQNPVAEMDEEAPPIHFPL